MSQKRSHKVANNESQFVSKLSQAELNYYQRLLPTTILSDNMSCKSKDESRHKCYDSNTHNNNCLEPNCDGKTDDERLKCLKCNGGWCLHECMISNRHKHYSKQHNIWKYKTVNSTIQNVFNKLSDSNGNNLLSFSEFGTKYKYENTIMQTENGYKISQIKVIDNNNNNIGEVNQTINLKSKAMKTFNYGINNIDEANDLLSKWIVMKQFGILQECDIYTNEYSIHCVQKLWHTDLETYIQTNPNNNNMFSANNNNIFFNQNIALLLKTIIPQIKLIHSYDIVIGDIKPANLMMDYNKYTNKPIDFGIIDFQCLCTHNTYWVKSFGTIHYRPPEMDITITNDNDFIITKACDIYSLGISLLEIINGTHPYFKQLKQIYPYFKIQNELNGFMNQEKIDKIINDNEWLQLNENKHLKDLLENMIMVDHEWRYDIDEIIHHPWYQKYCSS